MSNESNVKENMSPYYVINVQYIDLSTGKIHIARVDPKYKCFYDRHIFKGYRDELDEFKVGQTVEATEIDEPIISKNLVVTDDTINEEVTRIIRQREEFYKGLKEKYKKDLKTIGYVPSFENNIIDVFIVDRIINGLPADLYVLDILKCLSSAMGLRLRGNPKNPYFSSGNFTFPEELYKMVAAMYDIISEKLDNNESMRFVLYDFGEINEEYDQFLKEVERRTGYDDERLGSELGQSIRDEILIAENNYERPSKEAIRLSKMKPVIEISPERTTYYSDTNSVNAYQETFTPEESINRNKNIIADYDRGVFDDTNSTIML